MNRKSNTKQAFFTSVLSLLLTVTLFLGTTYAWFTDNVSSANNVIQGGNLDVELEFAKADAGVLSDWASVSGRSDVFSPDALWEPGRVEIVYLKVSNIGSLTLKYELNINVLGEVPGVNVSGEQFKLSDYLIFKVIEMKDDIEIIGSRQEAILAAGTFRGLNDYNGPTTTLEVGGVDYMALVVYMPEYVGNEANYRGTDVPSIDLGINLIATQAPYEVDSFGPDYDAGILLGDVSSPDEFRGAVGTDKPIVLDKDIVFDDASGLIDADGRGFLVALIIDKDTDIYLNGFSISYDGTADIDSLIHVIDGATLNLYGNTKSELSSIDPTGANAISVTDGSVVNIRGGTYTSQDVPVLQLEKGSTVNVYRALFYSDGYRDTNLTDDIFYIADDTDCKINFYGGTFVNFDPRTSSEGNLIADGYVVLSSVRNGGEVWYTIVPEEYKDYTPVYDMKEAEEAYANGNSEIFFAIDVFCEKNVENLIYGQNGEDIAVFGNGAVITADGIGTKAGESSDYGYVAFIPQGGGNATVTDIKVVGNGFVEVGDYHHKGGDHVITRLVIENLGASYHVNQDGNLVAIAYGHYGKTNTLIDCHMHGTTSLHEGYRPFDVGLPNGTTTFIEGGSYGSICVWAQAYVTITDAKVDLISTSTIAYKGKDRGRLTIGAGAEVGTIEVSPIAGYPYTLTIEDGAKIGQIIYKGVSYTQAEWIANPPT